MTTDEHWSLAVHENYYDEVVCKVLVSSGRETSGTESTDATEAASGSLLDTSDKAGQNGGDSLSGIPPTARHSQKSCFAVDRMEKPHIARHGKQEAAQTIVTNRHECGSDKMFCGSVHDEDMSLVEHRESSFNSSQSPESQNDANIGILEDKENTIPVLRSVSSSLGSFSPKSVSSENWANVKVKKCNEGLDGGPSSRSELGGLEHLTNLLNIMERLEELNQANRHLQQKCAFLEDTKMLLKEQWCLLQSETTPPEMARRKQRSKTTAQKSLRKSSMPGGSSFPGNRRSSEGERRRSLLPTNKQRSQSISSVCELVNLELAEQESGKTSAPTSKDLSKSTKSRVAEERRSLKLQEKWKQVKNVFSGKTETGAVSAELLLKSNSRKTTGSGKRSDWSLLSDTTSCSKNSLASVQQQELLLEKKRTSSRTPSVVLADATHDGGGGGGRRSDWSQPLPNVTSGSVSKNSCSEIPEEVSMLSAGEEADDSAFTPWVQQPSPARRQSSPLISVAKQPPSPSNNTIGNASSFLAVDPVPAHPIGRSSSFKVSKATPEVADEGSASKSLPSTPIEPGQVSTTEPNHASHFLLQSDSVRKTKGPWGKVKDILQTRRGSLKTKSSKTDDDLDDGKDETPRSGKLENSTIGPGKLSSRKFSVTPNLQIRLGPSKTPDGPGLASLQLPAEGKRYSLSSAAMSPTSPLDLAALFGVNDDFTKKMLEWEEKKKKGSTKGPSSTKFSEDFIRKMEEWEQKKGRGGPKSGGKDQSSPNRLSPEESPDVEEIQQFLSESFSRTVHDWEEVRRRHSESKEKEKKEKKENRSASREREKSQQRVEKELRKIEKKERKLEQELTKLAQLRLKLDSQLENRAVTERCVSQEVTKVEDWGSSKNDIQLKGVTATKSKSSASKTSSTKDSGHSQDEGLRWSDGACTAPVSPSTGSGRRNSVSVSQTSLDSLSSIGSQSLANAAATKSRRESLGSRLESQPRIHSSCQRTLSSPGACLTEKENPEMISQREEHMRRQVEEKQEEVTSLQKEVQRLMNQMNDMNRIYTETIEHFQRELWASTRLGQKIVQSEEMSVLLSQLANRLDLLQQHGDRMTKEISQTQMKIAREAISRRQTEQRLLQNLEQLHRIIESRTASSDLADVVIHLCSYITRVLSKASMLRQCIIERNLLIQELERHLLVQEVINKLLHADLERHVVELGYLREFQRLAVIKRWKTFNGSDSLAREEQLLQASTLSRTQEAKFPKIPQSCKKVQALLAQIANDPEPLDVDTDWLATIRKDAEHVMNLVTRGMQTDCFPTQSTSNASVQTVMTFCDCDFSSAKHPSPSEPFCHISASQSRLQRLHQQSLSSFPYPPVTSFNQKSVSMDKCISLLLPKTGAGAPEKTEFEYKPRKSSAPEFLTDVGDKAVWLYRSAFRPISSDPVPQGNKELLRRKFDLKVTSANVMQRQVDAYPSSAVGKCVRPFKSNEKVVTEVFAGEYKTSDETEKERHGVPADTDGAISSRNTETKQGLSPMARSKHSRKTRGDVETQEVERESQTVTPRRSIARHRTFELSADTNEVVDPEDELACGVMGGSEERCFWGGNMAHLKETRIDESWCDVSANSSGQVQGPLTMLFPPDGEPGTCKSSENCKDGSQGRGTPGASKGRPFRRSSSPIVVRKLKTATELMHDCGEKRFSLRPTSDPEYCCGESNYMTDDEQHRTPATVNCPTELVEGDAEAVESGLHREDTEKLSHGTECGTNSSVGSALDVHAVHSNWSQTTDSDTASPVFISIARQYNRFKPITPGPSTTVKPASQNLSSETRNTAVLGFRTVPSETDFRSYASSNSSIPTIFCGREEGSDADSLFLGMQNNIPQSRSAETGANCKRSHVALVSSRGSSRSAKGMCRALCLQSMSVELTDDSNDSSTSQAFSPQTSPPPSLSVRCHEQDQESPKSNKGKWPKKLFKVLK